MLVILKKHWIFHQSVFDNYAKGNFWLNTAYLGEIQRVVRLLSNQSSSFRIETYQSLLISGQLTFMLHYRIHGYFTLGIFNSKVVS